MGRGITEARLAAGATVVVCGRSTPEPGSLPDGVTFLAADVRDPVAVAGLMASDLASFVSGANVG